ncbi:MAG: DUF3226 domain-containing protein [Phycisphaerae bacterium]
MSVWSLLLCEGPHDQEFLCTLATFARGWQKSRLRPSSVPATFASDKYRFLVYDQRCLVVAHVGGVDPLLGSEGRELAAIARGARSVGLMLDADSEGVEARQADARRYFGPVLDAATAAVTGTIVKASTSVSDKRQFGLWVAPNCRDAGSLDCVIRQAAQSLHPTLLPVAERFIVDLTTEANHDWGRHRDKALLGSLGQLWRAGGSLASALQERAEWMSEELVTSEPFSGIVQFMKALLE